MSAHGPTRLALVTEDLRGIGQAIAPGMAGRGHLVAVRTTVAGRVPVATGHGARPSVLPPERTQMAHMSLAAGWTAVPGRC